MAATIQNEDLVTNIRPATNPTTMTTNAGTRTMTKDATIPGLGDVKFDSGLTANVLGFHYLQSQLKTEYNQKSNAFVVQTKNSPIIFSEKKGLCLQTISQLSQNCG